MGKYTGKSDFFDWCNMHNKPEDVIKKATRESYGEALAELGDKYENLCNKTIVMGNLRLSTNFYSSEYMMQSKYKINS